jgi:pyruvate formate lyase activating enzyme
MAPMERQELEQTRGVVFNVQRMSMHDGPGVRTNVFLKGCPLRCGWCANPESQQLQPELMLRAGQCIDCGQFAEPCAACMPVWLAERRRSAIQVEEIDARIAVCPTGALGWVGEWRTAGDVMAQVRRDQPFYGDGGGLTLTGGEPTMQPAFCAALLRLAKAEGIATAMETCGHTQWEVFAELLPLLDVLLFDVKQIDPVRHREHTGIDNALILENLRRIARLPGRRWSCACRSFRASTPTRRVWRPSPRACWSWRGRWRPSISCPITRWARPSTRRWGGITPGRSSRGCPRRRCSGWQSRSPRRWRRRGSSCAWVGETRSTTY